MRRESHVRFGGRAGETHPVKAGQGALARPLHLHPTDEGWLYLASVIDLASRHLLGYSMGSHHDATLVCDALQAAVTTRGRHRMPDTIFHTDRGAEGGFNWSSQHSTVRGCDGSKEASSG
jgi:transposase InsO family protein